MGAEADVTGDQDDEEAEDFGFDEAVEDVAETDGVAEGLEIDFGTYADESDVFGDNRAGEPGDYVSENGQDGHHEEDGDQAGHHEHPFGRDVHGDEGVDFAVDLHGGEFGGDGGSDASGDEDGDHNRGEFAGEGETDDGADEVGPAEFDESVTGLEGEDAADEEAENRDDRERGVADQEALIDEAAVVARQLRHVAERPHQEEEGGADVIEKCGGARHLKLEFRS